MCYKMEWFQMIEAISGLFFKMEREPKDNEVLRNANNYTFYDDIFLLSLFI